MAHYGFSPYVSVAKRLANGKKKMQRLSKRGLDVQPIEIEGRKIARTFWGEAWCEHLEKFSDYSNRLPRGRTYVRNGSVCHLEIKKGVIDAYVSGSDIYQLKVEITPLTASRWEKIKLQCAGQVGSLLELLQGKISSQVMEVVTDEKTGLFPSPNEIDLNCDCPDWATMCKHVAAVLYGIGARLDQQPELLFLLRGVDHKELISKKIEIPKGKSNRRQIKGDLSDVFGIELDESESTIETVKKKVVKRKAVKKKTATDTKSVVSGSVVSESKIKITKQKVIRPTGKTVVRMRKRFGMNVTQFSRLLGVSVKTVSTWEGNTERLTLKPNSLAALTKINMLDKAQAWKTIGE